PSPTRLPARPRDRLEEPEMTDVRYAKKTWPEIQGYVARDAVVIVPTAAMEEHGPHLPVDTDIVLGAEVATRAAQTAKHPTLVMPPLWVGWETHHMDFPGTIDMPWDAFIRYGLHVTRSLVHHGFRRIVILNSHGSNRPLIEVIARQTVIDAPHTHCV